MSGTGGTLRDILECPGLCTKEALKNKGKMEIVYKAGH